MLLIGFAGIGFAAYRRRSTTPLRLDHRSPISSNGAPSQRLAIGQDNRPIEALRARIALGGTLFYENSDRSEYTGEVLPSAG